MNELRRGLRPLTHLSALVVMGLVVTPVLATERAPWPDASVVDATHVEVSECDAISRDESGDVLVPGELTIPREIADVSATVVQALNALASPSASVCVDVAYDGTSLSVDGHIEVCGAVQDDHSGDSGSLQVGGVPIVIGWNGSIGHATLVAEVGGGELCLAITMAGGDLLLDAATTACAEVVLQSPGTWLRMADGDINWSLVPDELSDPGSRLAVGTETEVGIEVEAFWHRYSDSTQDTGSVIKIVELEGCGELLPNTALPMP
jgi:hypothetical protein